jgi:cobyrinic acid a,c-diamide synthase
MNRLLISAAHKSSGKTTISIGLCAALQSSGKRVQPFKKGPDYIDPMWLGQASGHDCINLDFYTMAHDEILSTIHQHANNSDICIIEGNKGLYDGLDIEGSNSNAALAGLTQTPVILVIDVQGMTRGIAPLLLGYQAFQKDIDIAGVILNQIRGSRHEDKLRAVIEHYTHIPVVGAVYHNPELAITERHLGLIPSNEDHEAQQQIQRIGKLIAEQVDLQQLQDIAAAAKPLPESSYQYQRIKISKPVKIAIARDAAFGFYYPDDLEAFKKCGAELIEFNTLEDNKLPECDALFIGGGFPETLMDKLEQNQTMRQSIKQAIENDLPAYVECGGLMYLSRSIHWQDKTHNMVGCISGDISMHQWPVGRGYVQLEVSKQHPWNAVKESSLPPASFPAHEFHYSSIENLPENAQFAYNVHRGAGINGKKDGYIYKNLVASYSHLRDTSENHWVEYFVNFIRSKRL